MVKAASPEKPRRPKYGVRALLACLVAGAVIGIGFRTWLRSEPDSAAEDAQMLRQAQELVAMTAQQVTIREKLVDALEKAPTATTEEREEASRGLITAKSELEQLRKWTAAFKLAIEQQDTETLKLKRVSFPRVVGRLRKPE
jgi:predicted negative regulator of RcsB-dependent stress response